MAAMEFAAQLGEFRERRALAELKRISSFSPEATAGWFKRTRRTLVAAAHEALAKIEDGSGGPSTPADGVSSRPRQRPTVGLCHAQTKDTTLPKVDATTV